MDCPECESLRTIFNDAITKSRDLVVEFQEAVAHHQTDEIDRLRLAIVSMGQERLQARTRLLAHDATHDRRQLRKTGPAQKYS